MRKTYSPSELLAYCNGVGECLVKQYQIRYHDGESETDAQPLYVISIVPELYITVIRHEPMEMLRIFWENIDWNGFKVIDFTLIK